MMYIKIGETIVNTDQLAGMYADGANVYFVSDCGGRLLHTFDSEEKAVKFIEKTWNALNKYWHFLEVEP